MGYTSVIVEGRVGEPRREALELGWLIKLRWVAVLGLALAAFVAERALHIALPRVVILALVGVGVTSNVVALLLHRTRSRYPVVTAALLVVDVLLLTAALYFVGGIYNPFVLSYLVVVVLAAVLLGRGGAVRISLLVAACVAGLALQHRPVQADHVHGQSHAHEATHHHEPHHHGRDVTEDDHVRVHAEEMWLAFAVLAALIAYLVSWSLRQRELELRALRAEKERNERLAELGALAGTAAHEIASPLTTIAVVAKELGRSLEASGQVDRAEDVRLIRREVDRCRAALDAMARRARGEATGPIGIAQLLDDARARLADPSQVALEIEAKRDLRVVDGSGAVVEVLRGLLANAVDASPEGQRVRVRASEDGERCRIDVIDDGHGMDERELALAGEEPFTTKGTMGMGLFAGRAVIEKLGGELELVSRAGRGTRVTLRLPLAESQP